MRVAQIYRFPVKGLPGQSLEGVDLQHGAGLADDRRFAIAHSASDLDPSNPEWRPKSHFFNLSREERLAKLGLDYDPEGPKITLLRKNKAVVTGDLSKPLGATLIEQFLGSFLSDSPRGTPRLVERKAGGFADCAEPFISIINPASVRDVERVARCEIDPMRFRGNIYLEETPAWAEMEWVGKSLKIGSLTLHIAQAIERCAATNVNPKTAERDLNVPRFLKGGFGHINMGVYATVETPGRLARGDSLSLS